MPGVADHTHTHTPSTNPASGVIKSLLSQMLLPNENEFSTDLEHQLSMDEVYLKQLQEDE